MNLVNLPSPTICECISYLRNTSISSAKIERGIEGPLVNSSVSAFIKIGFISTDKASIAMR